MQTNVRRKVSELVLYFNSLNTLPVENTCSNPMIINLNQIRNPFYVPNTVNKGIKYIGSVPSMGDIITPIKESHSHTLQVTKTVGAFEENPNEVIKQKLICLGNSKITKKYETEESDLIDHIFLKIIKCKPKNNIKLTKIKTLSAFLQIKRLYFIYKYINFAILIYTNNITMARNFRTALVQTIKTKAHKLKKFLELKENVLISICDEKINEMSNETKHLLTEDTKVKENSKISKRTRRLSFKERKNKKIIFQRKSYDRNISDYI
jgi:hypothetical protein